MKRIFKKNNKGKRNTQLQNVTQKVGLIVLYCFQDKSMTIQDLINRVRSNKSFSQTLSGQVRSAIASPTSKRKRSKISLRKYQTNFSLGRNLSQSKTSLQQFTETGSQSSIPRNTGMGSTLSVIKHAESVNSKHELGNCLFSS